MRTKLTLLLFFLMLFSFSEEIKGQEIWHKLEKEKTAIQESEIYQKKNFPSKYKLFSLDVIGLKNKLDFRAKNNEQIIELPDSKGDLSRFKIKETSNFEEHLAANFPMIKSYSAQGIEDPTAVAKISIGVDGFHAVIFYGNKETLYIDPYSKNNKNYITYKRNDLTENKDDFTCKVEEFSKKAFSAKTNLKNANDGKLRTFRMALACSGEYAQFHLTRQGVATSATDAVKKAAVLSAMNTSMTRVNGVYERDLAVRMILVANNDDIIFLDATTDGITDGDPDVMINQVQTICDTKIDDANYDIGHIFSIAGDGLAGGGVVCISGQKARGVTGRDEPVGDPYDIDYVAHEIGHQFGANHTQNNSCNRSNSTAVEPGSASTIMGYAGICDPNIQDNSDDYFHAVSIAEMWNTIQTSATCGVLSNTSNTAPIANAGADFSIPKSTPFILKGTATDVDGTASLTYNWEQIDNEIATMPPLETSIGGPMFRSLSSKTTPNRYMPELATVVAGNTSTTWEVLPSVARDLNFSFLVRDNHAGGGSTARDDVKISVTNADAFVVTTASSNIVWNIGTTQTITWNKGTTDIAPINCQNVNIKLSLDGGITFPIILKSNTPNDGTEDIVVPNNATTTARIMVEAADNIFYNVNTTNFTLNSTFVMNTTNDIGSVCNSGNMSANYTLNFSFASGFSENVTLTASGHPAGSAISFSPTSISADGSVIMTVSNLNSVNPQEYTINVKADATSESKNINVTLNVTTSNFGTLTLTTPVDNAATIPLNTQLQWNADTNATNYDVEVATDSGFSTIISSGNVTTNTYILSGLSVNTNYFWRVKPKNTCNEGAFSNVFNFTTLIPPYCLSTFTDDFSGTEYISNVTFNAINNNSGNATNSGYENFTSISTSVKRGDSHQISVSLDTGGFQDHCYVFIDWNQDYEFNKTTERYDLGTESSDTGTLVFTIPVPNDAKLGSTRMRVIIEYDSSTAGFGDGPCDADHLSERGETEDYTIEVTKLQNISVLTNSETCVNQNDGTVTVNVLEPTLSYNVTIIGETVNLNEQIIGSSHSFSNLTPGSYEVCVTTQQLNLTQCFEVLIAASNPVSLRVSENNQTNNYAFNVSSGTPPFEVYLDKDLLGVFNTNNFSLDIKKSGTITVKTAKDCEGEFNTSLNGISLKGNPVNETIELGLPINLKESFIDVVIFDINGKLIFKKSIEKQGSNLSIPFSNVKKGVYILKLFIANSKPIKIIKQ